MSTAALAGRIAPTKLRHRVALGLAGVLAALVLAEWGLHYVVPSSVYSDLHQAAADPRLGFELRPLADVEFDGITVRIPATRVRVSSQGLRGPEVVVPKPAGVLRLACVGDSVAFGWGVREAETYCAVLAATLGPAWEPLNLGVPGYGAIQKQLRFEGRGLPLQPDLVVFQFDQNDRDPPDLQADDDSLWAWLVDHSALARFIYIRSRLSQSGGPSEDTGSTDPPFDGEAETIRAFNLMASLGKTNGIPVVVMMNVTGGEKNLVAHITSLAVPVVDIGPALRGDARYGAAVAPGELEIRGDGHPTAEGHRRIAAALLPVVQQVWAQGRK